jgi:hypothetical protein
LHDGIRILSRAIVAKANLEDHNWLLEFSEGLKLLDDYDHEQLDKAGKHTSRVTYPAREEYMAIVESMRTEFNTAVFGMLKVTGFDSAFGQIQQGIGKKRYLPEYRGKGCDVALPHCKEPRICGW